LSLKREKKEKDTMRERERTISRERQDKI